MGGTVEGPVPSRNEAGKIMRDSRLRQAAALLDDARTLLIDVVDERPVGADPADYNNIDSARIFINSALPYIQAAEGVTP